MVYNKFMLNQEMNSIQPSFWAVLPANVRYSKKIGSTSKLIFAEITALSNVHGYCWAGNEYFAKLFDITDVQVSRIVKELIDNGFVRTVIDIRAGNSRKIYPIIDIQDVPNSQSKTLKDLFNEKIGVIASELEDEKIAFIDYWTAKNEGGKKEHWQKQSTFAIKQRWATWIKNKREWSRSKKPLPPDSELKFKAENRKSFIKQQEKSDPIAIASKPRTKEEQDRINNQIAKIREGLKTKFTM